VASEPPYVLGHLRATNPLRGAYREAIAGVYANRQADRTPGVPPSPRRAPGADQAAPPVRT